MRDGQRRLFYLVCTVVVMAPNQSSSLRPGGEDELFERFVGLGADEGPLGGEKGRHAGDALAVRSLPVGVDGVALGAGLNDLLGLIARQADLFGDADQFFRPGQIHPVDEIRRNSES